MRRIILTLAAAALMVVLMATTASPAIAAPPTFNWWHGVYGWGNDSDGDGIKNGWDPCPDDPLNTCVV